MDEQSAKKVNEAAQKSANMSSEAAQEVANLAISAQERNTRLAQNWVENMVESFNNQAETNRALTQSMESYTKVVENALKSQQETNRALSESLNAYRSVMENATSTQERNVRFMQDWVENVVSTLREQAEAQQNLMVDMPREQIQAFQSMAQNSMKAYMDLMSAPFSYYQGAMAGRNLPIENYDDLNVDEISKKIENLNTGQVATLKNYELQNKNRETLIQQFDSKLAGRSNS